MEVLNQKRPKSGLLSTNWCSKTKVWGEYPSHIHEMFAMHMTISPPESSKTLTELVVQG